MSSKWIRARRAFALLAGVILAAQLLRAEPSAQSAPVCDIARAPVRSSMLVSIGYDEPKRILELEFRSGSVYRYINVPAAIYHEMMAAESKGRFYNRRIKKHYKSQKLPSS